MLGINLLQLDHLHARALDGLGQAAREGHVGLDEGVKVLLGAQLELGDTQLEVPLDVALLRLVPLWWRPVSAPASLSLVPLPQGREMH